jgi:hypothetical protein
MKQAVALSILLLLTAAGSASAQAENEARAAIQIEATVLKGLDTSPASGTIDQVTEMVPGMVNDQTSVTGLDMTDIATMSEAVAEMPKSPGVVVTMLVLGADGSVVSGDTGGATLPSWMQDPTEDLLGASGAKAEGTGYYIYINVCACNV